MRAVIMAGGKGTRLVAITKNEIPKPMVPILGRPLLERQIEVLRNNGICDIIMVIGYLGDKIREYFSDGSAWGIRIRYLQEEEPLGTAGSFYYLKELLKEEPFLLVFGDVLFDIDICRMEAFHRSRQAAATLFVHPNSHPFDSDLVTVDPQGKVTGFDSKHNIRNYDYENCVNAGLYILDPSVCDLVDTPQKRDLEKDILTGLVKSGRAVYGYRSPEYIKDIGTEERIARAACDIRSGFIIKKCLKHRQRGIFIDGDMVLAGCGMENENEAGMEAALPAVNVLEKLNQSAFLSFIIVKEPYVSGENRQEQKREFLRKRISTLLGSRGVFVDEILFCTHYSDEDSIKEAFGKAAKQYHLDLPACWVLGNVPEILFCGKHAGLKTALIAGKITGGDGASYKIPELICHDLNGAVKQILEES